MIVRLDGGKDQALHPGPRGNLPGLRRGGVVDGNGETAVAGPQGEEIQ